MIWLWWASVHEMAIGGWMRSWLRGPFTDRFLLLAFGPWGTGWTLAFGLMAAIEQAAAFLWIALVPWLFLIVDSIVDGRRVRADLNRLLSRDDVILATRAEYIGGHPFLPHGRFVYLTIEGDRANPRLSIILPGKANLGDERYSMPLLDFDRSEEKRQEGQSMTGAILASISDK